MKKIIATTILACASAFVYANNAQTIEGQYACKGIEVDGKTPFTCDETIKKTGNTFGFTASCSDGTSYSGTGIYQHNTLALAFKNDKNASEVGVSIKSRDNKGNFTGQWTNLDKTEIGKTTCTKQTS
jgi:hypothetical protein